MIVEVHHMPEAVDKRSNVVGEVLDD